jgi:hypothetical protein
MKPSSVVSTREKENPQKKKSVRQRVYQLPSARKSKTTDLLDQEGKENRKTLRRRRRIGCLGCSACCCVGLVPGALLLCSSLFCRAKRQQQQQRAQLPSQVRSPSFSLKYSVLNFIATTETTNDSDQSGSLRRRVIDHCLALSATTTTTTNQLTIKFFRV